MAGQKKAELLAGKRAGMTVARAERLAVRAGQTRNNAPIVCAVLGLATVAALAGYGLIDREMFDATNGAAKVIEAQATSPAPADASTIAATSPAKAAPAAIESTTAPDRATVATTMTEPALDIVGAAPAPAACLSRIEGLVATLTASPVADRTWAKQQGGVTELVQAALDCESAGFRVAGSLELLGSGLADLKVEWRSDDRVLALAMIDKAETETVETSGAADGKTVQVVIR